MNVNKNMRVLRKRKNKGNNVNSIEQAQRKIATHIRIASDVAPELAEQMQKRGKKNTNRFVNRILRSWLKRQARIEAQTEEIQ